MSDFRVSSDNFGGIRLIAAICVILGHSFPLTGTAAAGYLGSPISTLAVKVFFVISGYLISESWSRDPHVLRYFLRRALRIFPGLIVLVLFSVFIVGPIFSEFGLRDYFAANGTWNYFLNIILRPNYFLPGLFANNIYPNAVNGSLWTLPVEFLMYILTPIFLVIFRSGVSLGIFAFALSAISVWFTRMAIPEHAPVFWGTNLVNGLEMAPYFFWGAFYKKYVSSHRLFNLQVALVMIVLLPMVAFNWSSSEIISLMIVPYVTLSLGSAKSPVLGYFDRFGDVSYGTYLYGFLVQQLIASFLPHSSHWSNFLLSLFPSLLLGALSWHLVEKRMLRLKPSKRR